MTSKTSAQNRTTRMSQPPLDFILAASQLGFRPQSSKLLTLIAPEREQRKLPRTVPFFVQSVGNRLARESNRPGYWSDNVFRWPYDIAKGGYTSPKRNYRSSSPQPIYTGRLKRIDSRWGTFWQGDFTDFKKQGIFQIETEYQFTPPFVIEQKPYERLLRSYLVYLFCQRSGFDVPGIRPATHLDDAILDSTGGQINAAGGWYDAGDLRKWLAFTQSNLEGLYHVHTFGHPAFRPLVLDEIKWGNRLFHNMVDHLGRVYEDIGGGNVKTGFDYETGWWFENHPGCIADNSGNYITDNIPLSGDERKIRTTYNPWCQFEFIKNQSLISKILPAILSGKCVRLARRAWAYSQQRPHDDRTLFLAGELRAAIELLDAGAGLVSTDKIAQLAESLLQRQDKGKQGLSGYFLERDGADAFRSFGFPCAPAMALLRLCELEIPSLTTVTRRAADAVWRYIESFLLKDAKTNPFGVTPYGVYINPPHPDRQLFRPAGRSRGVRTFLHPFNAQEMAHPCGAAFMHHAYLLARAGKFFHRPAWQNAAERLLQWQLGHNTVGLCLFTGVGFRHPIPFSAANVKIPEACICGWIGTPDDKPYMETSNAVEWNTQEIWDTVFFHAIGAIVYLD